MAKEGTAGSRRRNKEKEMEMDRPHPEKALYNHHPPGVDLESPGKEEEMKSKKQLEKGPGGRRSGDGLQLE